MNATQRKQCKYLSEQIMDDLLTEISGSVVTVSAMEHPTQAKVAVLIQTKDRCISVEDCGNFYKMLIGYPRSLKQPRLTRDYKAVLTEWMRLAKDNCYLG